MQRELNSGQIPVTTLEKPRKYKFLYQCFCQPSIVYFFTLPAGMTNHFAALGLNGNSSSSSSSSAPPPPLHTQTTTPPGDDSLKYEDLEILKTIGTGTFARVCLCRIKNNKAVRFRNNNNIQVCSLTHIFAFITFTHFIT